MRLTDLPELQALAKLAEGEGFRFVDRFASELATAAVPASLLTGYVAIVAQEQLVAIGGVTVDPYWLAHGVQRVRHVYVRPDWRVRGVGSLLLGILEARARTAGVHLLRLRTDTSLAARFYEARGYGRVVSDTATHQRMLLDHPLGASS